MSSGLVVDQNYTSLATPKTVSQGWKTSNLIHKLDSTPPNSTKYGPLGLFWFRDWGRAKLEGLICI